MNQQNKPVVIDALTRIDLKQETTLNKLGEKYDEDPEYLLEINQHIRSVDEPIQYATVAIPSDIPTNGLLFRKLGFTPEQAKKTKVVVRSHRLEPMLAKIAPKICEIVDRIKEFDDNSRKAAKQLDKQGIKYLLHTNLWTDNPKDDPFGRLSKVDYPHTADYKNRILKEYREASRTMGLFFRNQFYTYYLVFHYEFFEFKNSHIFRDTLQWHNHFFNVVMGRINRYLALVLHQYQMLNGSAQDWVIYQNLTDLINATFGELNRYFSQKGGINLYTNYPKTFFSCDRAELATLPSFTKGVGGTKINDEFVFSYSLDHKNRDTIEEIAQQQRDRLTELHQSMLENFESRLEEAIRLEALEQLGTLTVYIGKQRKSFEKFLKEYDETKELEQFDQLERVERLLLENIKTARMKPSEQHLTTASISFSIWATMMELFMIAGVMKEKIDWFDSLFVDEEELYMAIDKQVEKLAAIATEKDLTKASEQLQKIRPELEVYHHRMAELVEKGEFRGMLAKELLILAAVSIVTMGVGTLAAGAIGGVLHGARICSTAVRIGTFATEVVVFTLAHEGLSSLVNQRSFFDGSFGEFGLSLATNTLMFGMFRTVGGFVQKMLKTGAIKNGLAAVMANAAGNFLTGTLVCSPFLAVNLTLNGKNPFSGESGREWGQFLMTQAVLATFFGAQSMLSQKLRTVIGRVNQTGFKMGSRIRNRWETAQFQKREAEINKLVAEIKTISDRMNREYRSLFEPNKKTFEMMRQEYQQAVNKARFVTKQLRAIRTELLLIEYQLGRRSNFFDITTEGELIAMEQGIAQMEHWIASVRFTPDRRLQLAALIHNAMPQPEVNGLIRIGRDNEYYFGRVMKLIQNRETLRQLTMNGNPIQLVQVESRFRPELEEGIVQFQVLDKQGEDLATIRVIDLNGRGKLPNAIAEAPHRLLNPTRKFAKDPEKALELQQAPARSLPALHREFHQLTYDEVIEAIKTQDPKYTLTEPERIELKKSGGKPKILARIQDYRFDFLNKPITFVADAMYLVGTKSIPAAKTLIGYPNPG